MNKASMNILIQAVFVDTCIHFFGINLCVELLGSRVGIYLTLLDISEQFSKVSIIFYTPSAKYETSSCSSSSSTLNIVSLSNFGHSGGCIVSSNSWLKFAFS